MIAAIKAFFALIHNIILGLDEIGNAFHDVCTLVHEETTIMVVDTRTERTELQTKAIAAAAQLKAEQAKAKKAK